MIAARRRSQTEHDLGAYGRRFVARVLGLAQQPRDFGGGAALETKPEFRVREPQFAASVVAEFGSRFEVVGRYTEGAREHAQCLDRRSTGPRFDARDVRVGNTWGR